MNTYFKTIQRIIFSLHIIDNTANARLLYIRLSYLIIFRACWNSVKSEGKVCVNNKEAQSIRGYTTVSYTHLTLPTICSV